MIASPADFHGTPSEPRWIAPKLGEHTADVLRELGRSDAVIEDLFARQVAAQFVEE